MTKNELARELADDFELPRRQVIELVEAILERITQVLKSGDKVQLTPFGQFKIRDRAARVARNPQTGEPVNVPAKRVLKFIAGRSLKEAVGTAKPGRGGAKKSAGGAKKSAGAAKKSAGAAKKTAASKGAAGRKASAPAKKTAAKKAAGGRKTAGAKKSRGR
ncbi:MAG: DNA-binding protein HU-beta [Candidatus Eremiobacteraeota bacterium]|jgi:DNA-binding protein HU-beta|nr:DNA-binding protein HU-beta [Candidatus Eremiobacteraeota bacterium]